MRPVTSTSRASSSSSDSDWDAETARSLRGDFYSSARETSFAKKAPAGKTKQSDAARLQAALVRERLDAAVKKSARKEKRAVAERDPTTRKAVTFATSAAPETAPLLAASVSLSQTPRKPASLAGASLTRLVLLSAVALLGVMMLSAGASSVFAATLSDENARETRFAAEKRDAQGTRSDSEARFAAGPEPETTPARFAGVRPQTLVAFCLGLSGALAGAAGLFEVAGPAGQITDKLGVGYGFTAIIVAFLGRLHPVGILLAGLLLALLSSARPAWPSEHGALHEREPCPDRLAPQSVLQNLHLFPALMRTIREWLPPVLPKESTCDW